MPDSRFPPIAFALLLIACLCIYGIILDPGATFAGMDFLNLNYPRAVLTKQAFGDGVLPLWNWYEWGGAPLLAALQGAVLYPPTWIALLLPLPYGLQMFVFFHLLAAGYGAFVVARNIWKMSVPAAALCGIMYMGCGFFPGRIEQFQIIAVNCLLPWLVLAVWFSFRRSHDFWMLPLIWAFTLLAGHPQYAVFNAIAALGLTSLVYLGSWRRRWKSFARVISGFALGTGAAAMQLLPTWELGQLSERIWPYPEPTLPELEWSYLPALLIPKFYNFLTGEPGRVFGYTELGLYLGILAVPLTIFAVIRGRVTNGLRRRLLISAVAIWIAAMVFALGRNGLVAPLIFKYAPFFTQTRGAARSLNVASLMLALLAAQGATSLVPLISRTGWRKPASAIWILAILTCFDLSLNGLAALKSVMVPRYVLSAKPLESNLSEEPGRLYRFMASDSDIYLNNSPAAVAERFVRVQPNLSSILKIPLVDGYEEGLLPTRTYANLQRRFNRNLRSDSPDAALLAFLGSGKMLTEYPIQANGDWRPASQLYPRPSIVPPVMGSEQAHYQYWNSEYAPGLVLDLDALSSGTSADLFLMQCAGQFPLVQSTRIPTQLELQSHPFDSITPESFQAAQKAFPATETQWNRITAKTTRESTAALILLRPYPGWKPAESQPKDFVMNSLCSLFYCVEVVSSFGSLSKIELVFEPFSLRFGLFISLISVLFYAQILCANMARRIKLKQVMHERD